MKKKDTTGLKTIANSSDEKDIKIEIQFVGRQESFNNSIWLTPSNAAFFGESLIKLGKRMIEADKAREEHNRVEKQLRKEERKEAS